MDKENTLFVSVVIPVYNGDKTIGKCLEGALKQDYPRDKYEIIVVDDGSEDRTNEIAKDLADNVITHAKNLGLNYSRMDGMKVARGDIIVNTDVDVLMPPGTLAKITGYFLANESVDALTGLLAKESPDPNFFSWYKNLYMHYVFRKLPDRVTFLYGSIHALRRGAADSYRAGFDIGEDTAFGQSLVSAGKKIAFLRDLEVTHLKKYTVTSFVKNDFLVPFNWAKIFLKYKGWRQLGRNNTGFAHASKMQLAGLMTATALFVWGLSAMGDYSFFPLLGFISVIWALFNIKFLKYLAKERGVAFGILAIFVSFLDNIVMVSGIICGFCEVLIEGLAAKRRKK